MNHSIKITKAFKNNKKMYKPIEIVNGVFYVGVNDRRTHLFENMLPIPQGVSYNSYVILDEQTALVDTVEIACVDTFISRLKATLDGRALDYLIVNHMEPDHSGSLKHIINEYPNVTIVGNKKTFDFIAGFYGVHDKQLIIGEGDKLQLGSGRYLQFFMTPMVHWPETMVTYDTSSEMLFSGDAFGGFGTLDGGVIDNQLNTDRYWDEMRRYYANIVGKYGSPVQKAIKKLEGVPLKYIGSTHGPVWHDHLEKVVGLYDQWSRYEAEKGVVIVYGSMYGNTEEMAEAIARELSSHGVRDIILHDVSKTHASYILSDIFKCKGLIIGSPTYCNELYPGIESLLKKIAISGVSGRYCGFFGSFSWAGVAVKKLQEYNEKMKWELVADPVEEKYVLKEEKYQACATMAAAMAKCLLGK